MGQNPYQAPTAHVEDRVEQVSVKIVRHDGSRVALGRVFGLRMVVPSIIYMVPLLGFVFYLVDVLFIFRGDRRCVHDLMADTRVVSA